MIVRRPKKVLFYPLHETSIIKFLKVIDADKEGKLDVIFLLTGLRLLKYIPVLLERDIQVWRIELGAKSYRQIVSVEESEMQATDSIGLNRDSTLKVNVDSSSWFRVFIEHFPVLVRFKKGIYFLRKSRVEIRWLLKKYKVITQLVNTISPEVVVLCGDRHLQYEPALIRVCSEQRIPMKIPPVSISPTPNQLVGYRASKGSGAFVSDAVSRRFRGSKQFRDYRGQGYVSYYEPWQMEALRHCNMLTNNPWVIGGSGKVTVMAPGHELSSKIEAEGVPKDKIVMTGDPDYDDVFTSLRHRSRRRSDFLENKVFEADRLFLGLSLPQYLEHKLSDDKTHWSYIHRLCELYCDTGQNVCLSLHPKMDPEKYSYLEQKYNLVIVRAPLRNWIGALDIFSASCGSSTLSWSSRIGIPTIAFDWLQWRLGYSDIYTSAELVETPDEYEKVLTRLVSDNGYASKLGGVLAKLSVMDQGGCTGKVDSSKAIISELLR